jgi:L-threonylcarbamoyladenylate synthase
METRILPIDVESPEPEVLAEAASVIRSGGLVAFPTETVYGLGADALNATAVAKIFAAKGRPAVNPLIVHVADRDGAKSLVSNWPELAETLAQAFWPGPLTLVLPKADCVPDIVTGGGATVAIRMPSHAIARELIRAAGTPLAAPSANRSTRLSATTAQHVARTLAGRIDLILDGGATPGGLESTVVDLTGDSPRLLRPGLLSAEQIEAVLNCKLMRPRQTADESFPLPSPGMLSRHYAPTVPLECAADSGEASVRGWLEQGKRVGWLAWGEPSCELPAGVVLRPMPEDPQLYAAGLYAALHDLEASGVERIVVALPPNTPAWLAIHDRLRRASTPG